MFNKSRFIIYNHHQNFLRDYRFDGRPPILTDDEGEILKNKIKEMHSNFPPEYPTYIQILNMINEMFDKTIRIDTLRKLIITSWSDIFKICTCKAMDSDREEVPIESIERNLIELNQAI